MPYLSHEQEMHNLGKNIQAELRHTETSGQPLNATQRRIHDAVEDVFLNRNPGFRERAAYLIGGFEQQHEDLGAIAVDDPRRLSLQSWMTRLKEAIDRVPFEVTARNGSVHRPAPINPAAAVVPVAVPVAAALPTAPTTTPANPAKSARVTATASTPSAQPESIKTQTVTQPVASSAPTPRPGLFKRFGNWIGSLFGKKKKEEKPLVGNSKPLPNERYNAPLVQKATSAKLKSAFSFGRAKNKNSVSGRLFAWLSERLKPGLEIGEGDDGKQNANSSESENNDDSTKAKDGHDAKAKDAKPAKEPGKTDRKDKHAVGKQTAV